MWPSPAYAFICRAWLIGSLRSSGSQMTRPELVALLCYSFVPRRLCPRSSTASRPFSRTLAGATHPGSQSLTRSAIQSVCQFYLFFWWRSGCSSKALKPSVGDSPPRIMAKTSVGGWMLKGLGDADMAKQQTHVQMLKKKD